MAATSSLKIMSSPSARLALLAVLLVASPTMTQALQPAAEAKPATSEAPGASKAWTDTAWATGATAKAPWVASGSLLWKSKLEPQPPLKIEPGC